MNREPYPEAEYFRREWGERGRLDCSMAGWRCGESLTDPGPVEPWN